jgi:hypothetical protein
VASGASARARRAKDLVLQCRQDGAETLGALGMVRARLVAEAGGMGQQQGCHQAGTVWGRTRNAKPATVRME